MVRVVKSTILDASVDRVWGILRDFNGHDRWHPAVKASSIERHLPSDLVGCVRRFQLQDGSELREQLLTLSDLEMTFSYCLLDTPDPALQLRCARPPAARHGRQSHVLAVGVPVHDAARRGGSHGKDGGRANLRGGLRGDPRARAARGMRGRRQTR